MYELRVSSGMHRCATLPLCGKSILIGAGRDADLMLADPGILSRHAMLRNRGAAWVLSAADGPVYHAGDDGVSTDIAMVPGCFARVGDIWVTLVEQGAPWTEPPAAPCVDVEPMLLAGTHDRPARRARTFARHGATLFALGAITLAAAAYAVATKSTTGTPAAPAATAATAVNAAADSIALREDFRSRLEQAGLLSRFDLAFESHEWRMKGELDDEETKRFEQTLVGFMREYRIGFPVQANVARAEAKLPFKIRQVVSGANAAIVTEDGERIAVGESYRGVRLVAVRGHRIVLAGKRKMEIHW